MRIPRLFGDDMSDRMLKPYDNIGQYDGFKELIGKRGKYEFDLRARGGRDHKNPRSRYR